MSADRRPLIVGNWKLNGTSSSLSELVEIADANAIAANPADLVICPPATLISAAAKAIASLGIVAIGAQDCSSEIEGAFTGDISAAMISDAGASYVILGHSERRQGRGETDHLVITKVRRAIAEGLSTIVCVGESEDEMLAGKTELTLKRQIASGLPQNIENPDKLVVAYEPIWAIGTGRTPTIERIAEIHKYVREVLVGLLGRPGTSVRILYGGSVKPNNAAGLSTIPNVDGVLVGGASLKAKDFLSIAEAFRLRNHNHFR